MAVGAWWTTKMRVHCMYTVFIYRRWWAVGGNLIVWKGLGVTIFKKKNNFEWFEYISSKYEKTQIWRIFAIYHLYSSSAHIASFSIDVCKKLIFIAPFYLYFRKKVLQYSNKNCLNNMWSFLTYLSFKQDLWAIFV